MLQNFIYFRYKIFFKMTWDWGRISNWWHTHRHTHRQTDIRTCWAASSQLKIFKKMMFSGRCYTQDTFHHNPQSKFGIHYDIHYTLQKQTSREGAISLSYWYRARVSYWTDVSWLSFSIYRDIAIAIGITEHSLTHHIFQSKSCKLCATFHDSRN